MPSVCLRLYKEAERNRAGLCKRKNLEHPGPPECASGIQVAKRGRSEEGGSYAKKGRKHLQKERREVGRACQTGRRFARETEVCIGVWEDIQG